MIPLDRLLKVATEQDLFHCLHDAFQYLIAGIQQGQQLIDIVPPKHAFLTGTIQHLHPNPELIITCSGHGYLTLTEGQFPIRPNALVITPRGVAHREFASDPNESYANIIVGCTSHHLGGHLRLNMPGEDATRIRHRFGIKDSRMQRVSRYFTEAANAHGEEQGPSNSCSTGLTLAACSVLKDIVADRLALNQSTPSNQEHLISTARTYIEQHISNPDLRVSDIAEAIGCSADYLSHRFHQLCKQHLSRWIIELRLELACILLREGNLNIKEIAFASGFKDSGYFSRCFRASHGLSPRGWRKSLAI